MLLRRRFLSERRGLHHIRIVHVQPSHRIQDVGTHGGDLYPLILLHLRVGVNQTSANDPRMPEQLIHAGALSPIHGEHLAQHVLQFVWQLWRHVERPPSNVVEKLHEVVALEGDAARDQKENGYAQRPHVHFHAGVIRVSAGDFGRLEGWTAGSSADVVVLVVLVEKLGNAKVRDLEGAVDVEHHVGGLDIAVNDALPVHVVQALQYLVGVVGDLGMRQGSVVAFCELGDGAAIGQLQDDVGL